MKGKAIAVIKGTECKSKHKSKKYQISKITISKIYGNITSQTVLHHKK